MPGIWLHKVTNWCKKKKLNVKTINSPIKEHVYLNYALEFWEEYIHMYMQDDCLQKRNGNLEDQKGNDA